MLQEGFPRGRNYNNAVLQATQPTRAGDTQRGLALITQRGLVHFTVHTVQVDQQSIAGEIAQLRLPAPAIDIAKIVAADHILYVTVPLRAIERETRIQGVGEQRHVDSRLPFQAIVVAGINPHASFSSLGLLVA